MADRYLYVNNEGYDDGQDRRKYPSTNGCDSGLDEALSDYRRPAKPKLALAFCTQTKQEKESAAASKAVREKRKVTW